MSKKSCPATPSLLVHLIVLLGPLNLEHDVLILLVLPHERKGDDAVGLEPKVGGALVSLAVLLDPLPPAGGIVGGVKDAVDDADLIGGGGHVRRLGRGEARREAVGVPLAQQPAEVLGDGGHGAHGIHEEVDGVDSVLEADGHVSFVDGLMSRLCD